MRVRGPRKCLRGTLYRAVVRPGPCMHVHGFESKIEDGDCNLEQALE